MNGTSQPSVTYFDPNGDTRLLFNEGKPDEKIFVVSYKTMSLVCDSWDRMLNPNGPFREATQDGPISLPDDDWKGFEILMNIAHLHFKRVPRRINFQLLLSIAVLTEKYGATKIVRPWSREWLKYNKKVVDKPGHEEWLWIAWAFGQDQIFERLAKKLVLEVGAIPVGRLTNSAGVVLDANDTGPHFPPGIFGI
ncbi:hypothetical protein BK809_0000656 [Diplodia seriata]|uniref:Nuclear pore protein n=1 Tax=Diplodia seriata TaxID=420778 RepID=A0A1S8BBR2_9PEZI|nr:hypothetical protein BK809_0000656 [Diplodia seriata]